MELRQVRKILQVESVTKRTWTVIVAGYAPFQMVVLDGALTYDEALAEARCIWPRCEVK